MYRYYADTLYGIIFRILQRKNESEEVLQNVFIKIWNNIDTYDSSKATLFTWMAQIARNAAIDVKRLKSFEINQKTESISERQEEVPEKVNIKGIDLENLTNKIPDKYKIILDKMFLQGYTQQEVSDELQIPLGTVKTRMRDGVSHLRELLKGEQHLLKFLVVFI